MNALTCSSQEKAVGKVSWVALPKVLFYESAAAALLNLLGVGLNWARHGWTNNQILFVAVAAVMTALAWKYRAWR